MNNLVVTVFHDGSSREYLFTGTGPYKIGGKHQTDIAIAGVDSVCFEFTLSGGEILVSRIGDEEVSLAQQIIPKYGQVLYREEDVISIHGHQIEIKKVADEATPPPFFEPEFRAEFIALEKKVEARKIELKSIMNDLSHKERQLSGAKSNLETLSQNRHHLNLQIDQLKSEKKGLDGDLKKIKSQAYLEDEKLRNSKIELENLHLERQSVQQHIQKLQVDLKQAKHEAENAQINAKDERGRVEKIQTEIHHLEGKVEELEKLVFNRSEHIAQDEKRIQELSREAEDKLSENQKIENGLSELKKNKIKIELDLIELNEKHEVNIREVEKLDLQLQSQRKRIHQEEIELQAITSRVEECLGKEIEIKSFQEVLKLETVKIEADHARKLKIFTSLELDYQKAHKELARLTYEADDLAKKINHLNEQEQKQLFKIDMLKGEHQSTVQALQLESTRLNNEHNEQIRKLKDETHTLTAKLDEIKICIRAANDDLMSINSKREKSQVLVESLEVSKRHVVTEIKELELKRDNISHEVEQLNNQWTQLQRQHQIKIHELKDLDLRLHQTQSYISQIQTDNEKDLEVKRYSFDQKLLIEREALLNEIDLMKIKALKELETEKLKREEEIREQADKLLVSAHRRLNEASYEAQEREAKSHTHLLEAQKVYQEREKAAQDLYVQAEQKIQSEYSERKQRMRAFLTNKQDKSLKALVQLNALHLKKLSKLEFQSKIKIEQIKRSELKKIAQIRDLELVKQNELKDRLKLEIKDERKKVIHQLNMMKVEQERELETTKKLALQNIQNTKSKTLDETQLEIKRERESFEKSKGQRLQNATHSVLKILSTQELPLGFEQQLKQCLSHSLDGKFSISTDKGEKILEFNPLNQKKIIPVLQKYGIRFGIPAAILLTFGLDIGSMRTKTKNLIVHALEQKESASEKYVSQQKQEWREKNTYNPETTLGYKATFTDNVLYTTDFLKVVSDETFQNDWILKLHGFITTDLELSEDIAISYISSEGALIKELEMARGDIHPNYLDAGLSKLQEIEKKHLAWLESKVTDKKKLDKLVGFRKDFYEGFYETQFKPNRSMASEPKPQEVLKILAP